MKIEAFRRYNRPENYIITQHGRRRLAERGIFLRDVISAVQNGEIIEEYPEDYPYPSCLILDSAQPLHVVASLQDGCIYLITAYIPDRNRWQSDLKTRREDKT